MIREAASFRLRAWVERPAPLAMTRDLPWTNAVQNDSSHRTRAAATPSGNCPAGSFAGVTGGLRQHSAIL